MVNVVGNCQPMLGVQVHGGLASYNLYPCPREACALTCRFLKPATITTMGSIGTELHFSVIHKREFWEAGLHCTSLCQGGIRKDGVQAQ